MEGYRSDSYGDAFADVYDHWYPGALGAGTPSDAAAFLADLTDGPVLELGSGTGRLAAPLRDRGRPVIGLDVSAAMLARSRERHPGVAVARADMAVPPVRDGAFGAVVAAFNTLFNADPDGQACTLAAAARALAPGGAVVVEAFVPGQGAVVAEDRVDVSRLEADAVVLLVSRNVPEGSGRGVVFGQHVELRDGEPVRLRPWRVCFCSPAVLDELAATAGLRLAERWATWDRQPFDHASSAHVSVYRHADGRR